MDGGTMHDALLRETAALRERLRVEGEARELLIEDGQRLRKRIAELEDEHAAAEQREQQARAIIEPMADALWDDDETLHFVVSGEELMTLDFDHGDSKVRRLVTQARAWLAASEQAAQRAASTIMVSGPSNWSGRDAYEQDCEDGMDDEADAPTTEQEASHE